MSVHGPLTGTIGVCFDGNGNWLHKAGSCPHCVDLSLGYPGGHQTHCDMEQERMARMEPRITEAQAREALERIRAAWGVDGKFETSPNCSHGTAVVLNWAEQHLAAQHLAAEPSEDVEFIRNVLIEAEHDSFNAAFQARCRTAQRALQGLEPADYRIAVPSEDVRVVQRAIEEFQEALGLGRPSDADRELIRNGDAALDALSRIKSKLKGSDHEQE